LVYYLHEKAWDYFTMPRKRERPPLRQSSYGREKRLSAVFQRLRRASNPSGAKSLMGLEAIEATPPSWAVTLALGENPREVALVNKTTELRNISELTPRIL
jgi:hypothetical protein